MNNSCRVCLKPGISAVHIFKHNRNGKTFSEMLMDCAPITIKENDGLPCHLCIECTENLTESWHFREAILKGESELRKVCGPSLITLSIIKEEPGVYIPKDTEIEGGNKMMQLELPVHLMKSKVLLFVPNAYESGENKTIVSDSNINLKHVPQRKPLLDHDYIKTTPEYLSNTDCESSIVKDGQELQEDIKERFLNTVRKSVTDTKNFHNFPSKNNFTDINEPEKYHTENLLNNDMLPLENQVNTHNVLFPIQAIITNTINSTELPTNRDATSSEIRRKPRTVFCTACERSFSRSYYYTVHVPFHISQQRFPCNICNKSFIKRFQLNKHKTTHIDQKQTCNICGKVLKNSYTLKMHKTTHESVKSYSCKACRKTFRDERQLNTHMLVHTGEKNFMCEICGKSFVNISNLRIHATSHDTERTISCPICKKLFPNKRKLQVHSLIHTDKRPYICDVCGKSFKLKKSMREHVVLVHSGKYRDGKRNSCQICGKIFKDPSSIPRHMLVHTGETPYSCDKCSYSCKYKQQFDKHVKKHK